MTLPKPEQNSTHAKLSASSAHRWSVCTGSVALSEHVPNTTSEYAAQGTFAHHIAAECLLDPTKYQPSNWLGEVEVIDGYSITCDQEMVDAVEDYLRLVRQHITSDDDILLVETDFTPELIKLHPDFGGSSDAIVISRKTKTIYVFDLKYGAGIKVDVYDNIQLKYYALGALLASKANVDTVVIGVIQPRLSLEGDALSTFEFDAVDLIDFSADLIDAANETADFDAPLVPGDKQCQWCPVADCPALKAKQDQLMTQEFEIVNQELSDDTLGKALDIIPLVEARIKQLRELAYQNGLKGSPPPGYKIVDKIARRKWKSAEDAETKYEILLGSDAFTEPKLKTPPQIEKILSKADKKSLEEDVEKKSSGFTLVHESDKRQPALLAAPDDFDIVENKEDE